MSGPDQIWLLVGTYNHPEPHAPVARGAGIVTCAFDLQTGGIEQRHVCPGIVNSSYLACDPAAGLLFSTSESMAMANSVHMLRFREDGSLEHLGRQPAHGLATCHVAMLPDGRVCAASYLQSCITIFPTNGTLLEPAAPPITYEGSGPNTARQEASHAHQVVVAPGGRWFYVVDLGADCVWQHDAGDSRDPVRLPMPAGHGPRHMAFHPSLRRAYVLGEMTGAVTVCDWCDTSGMLEVAAVTTVLSEDASGAAIRVHPSGKTLWTSIRSTHSLRCFPLDAKGDPSQAVEISLGAGEPRDFNISPDGRWLVAANQSANHLAVVELDPADGVPAGRPVATFEMGTPCCVLFIPARPPGKAGP